MRPVTYAVLVLICACFIVSAGYVTRPQSNSSLSEPTVLATSVSVVTSSVDTQLSKTGISMTAIDVGRGDVLLVTYPNGKHMLVDAGGSYAASHFVIPYLIQKGITRLDAIVCTHEHWDHIDGLTALLKDDRITVGNAYDSGFPMTRNLQKANGHERASIEAYLAQLKEKHVKRLVVTAGDTLDVGHDGASQKDTLTYVLSPNPALTTSLQKRVKDTEGVSNHAAINENSLVLRIGYGKVHFLLAGDTSLPGSGYADAAMLDDPTQSKHLSADVLKLGHHGFSKPDDAFYSVVKPRYVVMTFGPQLRTSEPY